MTVLHKPRYNGIVSISFKPIVDFDKMQSDEY